MDIKHEFNKRFERDRLIDKYDHEANARGCKIFNYDYYERQRNIEALLLVGTLGLYFIIGMLIGFVGTLG